MDLTEFLARYSEQQVAGFLLVLGRVSPLFLLAPLFSSRLVNARVRALAAVGLALGLTPLATKAAVPLEIWTLAGLMGKEILVGLAFAYTLAALFGAISAAGSILDLLVGFSYGSLVDPITGNQSTVLAQLYGLVSVTVFIAIGGDLWLIRGLAETYELVPLLDAPALGSLVAGAQEAFAGVMAAAVQVAAPVLIALIITDAALGVLNRVVPQLNVFAVGFPAKVAVGLLIIAVSLPFAAEFLAGEVQRNVAAALDSLRVI